MIRYHASLRTPVPPGAAFADLSRFDRALEWDPSVESAAMLTPEPVGPGSRFELHVRFLGRTVPFEYEVVEFEAGRRVTLLAENGFVRSTDTITFASEPDGGAHSATTLVTYDARLEPKGAMRLARPLLAAAFRRIGDRAAGGLARRLQAMPA